MRRILLLAAVLAVALPTAAEAAVIPSVNAGTLTVTGDGAADTHHAAPHLPHHARRQRRRASTARRSREIEIRSGAGDDTIRIADALTEPTTIESGAGADTVIGGPGAETIATGDDGDFVQPGGGDDTVLLGAATTPRSRATGFDSVDGQSGQGHAARRRHRPSPRSSRCRPTAPRRGSRATRGPSTTDSTAVETLDVTAAGGPDLVDIGDLDGDRRCATSTPTSASSTARATRSTSRAPTASTTSASARSTTTVRVEGLDSTVIGSRTRVAADDRLTVFGRGGVDFITADRTVGARIALTLDGGAGTDVIDGSDAADIAARRPGRGRRSPAARATTPSTWATATTRFTRTVADGIDRVEGGAGVDHAQRVRHRERRLHRGAGPARPHPPALRVHRLGRHGRRRAHHA